MYFRKVYARKGTDVVMLLSGRVDFNIKTIKKPKTALCKNKTVNSPTSN
jgi:hypothetical protein